MNPNMSNSSSNAPNAPSPRPDSAPIDGDRYKVGVELEDVTSNAGGCENVSRPRANRATAKQPPRSMCFMAEDCKWCRPESRPRSTVPEEQEESPAVNALRECLETLQRDRLKNAEAKRRRAGLVQRCLYMCGKGV